MQSQMVALLLAGATLLPDPENPRRRADSEELRLGLRLLGEDMKRRGVIVPLIVRPDGEMYVVIDGHRRLAAAKLLGIEKLPCIVVGSGFSQAQARETQLVTQLHSQALTPYEVYAGMKSWLELHPGASARQLAAAISRTEAYVSKVLSLDRCAPAVRAAASEGTIGLSDWYAISKAPAEPDQAALLAAKRNGASRDELEGRVKRAANGPTAAARVARLRCQLPGVCVTLAGAGEGMTLGDVEEALVALLKEVRRGKEQGLDSKTFSAVLRDKAKAT